MDIYPAIDLKGGHCVRLSQGQFSEITTYSEDPLKMATRWQSQGALRLHVVDLDGARTGSPNTQNLDVLRQIIRQVGLPVQFGGGVRSAEVVERMLRLGVDRVVVSTIAIKDAAVAEGIFQAYGDRVAVSVDARAGRIAVQGWEQRTVETGIDFAQRMARLGARRVVYTDIERDGMLLGIEIKPLLQVALAVPALPVIVAGGITTLNDIDALDDAREASAPNLEGAIIGKALYAGRLSLADVMARTRPVTS